LKVYKGIQGFRGESLGGKTKFSTWLYTIAGNRCLNQLNKIKNAEVYTTQTDEDTLNCSMRSVQDQQRTR